MQALPQPWREGLKAQVKAQVPVLLAGTDHPHDELLALVWGPRFDREHALSLAARQAHIAPQAVRDVLGLADHYDALGTAAQRHLRRLIQRHRATMPHHAPHPAD